MTLTVGASGNITAIAAGVRPDRRRQGRHRRLVRWHGLHRRHRVGHQRQDGQHGGEHRQGQPDRVPGRTDRRHGRGPDHRRCQRPARRAGPTPTSRGVGPMLARATAGTRTSAWHGRRSGPSSASAGASSDRLEAASLLRCRCGLRGPAESAQQVGRCRFAPEAADAGSYARGGGFHESDPKARPAKRQRPPTAYKSTSSLRDMETCRRRSRMWRHDAHLHTSRTSGSSSGVLPPRHPGRSARAGSQLSAAVVAS